MIGSNWKALTGKVFGVLDRRSLMGGGRIYGGLTVKNYKHNC